MPGPPPKDPARRRRGNRTAGARVLSVARSRVKPPELPALAGGSKWRPETEAWWAGVWSSPMAAEYDPSDVHGLYVLAVLVDRFWRKPSKDLAAEIRLQRQCFGLTPIDRRRLSWEIDRGETADARRDARRTRPAPAPVSRKTDPRLLLAGDTPDRKAR